MKLLRAGLSVQRLWMLGATLAEASRQ